MSNILIVDDHSPARSLIRAIVRLDGHTVSEAGSGEDALARIAGTDYDLVILDLVMPGVDGYQVLERLRVMAGHEDTRMERVVARPHRRLAVIEKFNSIVALIVRRLDPRTEPV